MKKQELILKWLNKEFSDLTKVVKGDRTFYVDDVGKIIFYYFEYLKNKYVYINYDRIWVFFEDIFGLRVLQIREILKVWLEETCNLRGLTPYDVNSAMNKTLEETYNLN